MRLAVAQLPHVEPDDTQSRIDETVSAIGRGADTGARMVVLPELAASGYVLETGHLQRTAEQGDASGPVLAAWRQACERHGVAAVGGYAERVGDRIFNAAVAIDRSGRVVATYRKLHLFGTENDVFTPGDLGLPVIDVDGVRVGMLICYDLRFPEAVRILALRGAELIAVPTAWVAGFDRPDRAAWRQIGQVEAALVHANLNQVFLACADFVGTSRGIEFLGRSLVIDPYGEVVDGPLDPEVPGMIVTDIHLGDVVAARDRGPGISPRANRRTDVYHELLGYHCSTSQEPNP